MNENAQMMTEQYQNKLEEIYSPDFQHDLLETCIETFGEDFREQFEENFKRISIYPKFNLNKEYNKPIEANDKQQYFENTSYSLMKSIYDKFDIDPKDYGVSTLEEILQEQFIEKLSSSYTSCCVNKDTNEVCYPIFINMNSRKEDANLRGTIAHEVLHALEFITQRDKEGLKVKTGHYDWEETGKNVLTAECLHVAVLFKKIYPELREKGYEITDSCDYMFYMGEGFLKFFNTYFQQICRTACQPDLHELTDVIGTDNWEKFVELQNDKGGGIFGHTKQENEQSVLVDSMKEYSRNSLAQRIGKATLNKQLDIKGKKKVEGKLEELIHNRENSVDLIQGDEL